MHINNNCPIISRCKWSPGRYFIYLMIFSLEFGVIQTTHIGAHICLLSGREWAVCLSLFITCHWWRQKLNEEQPLVVVQPQRSMSLFSYIYFIYVFLKDFMDFHGQWWIGADKGKLLPVWKDNFKWLIYIHIEVKSVLIWMYPVIFMLCNNCNKCQAGFIIC